MQAIWVELPAVDINRARDFYQAVFEIESADIQQDTIRQTCTLANIGDGGSAGISLTQTANFTPRTGGTLVYMDAGDALAAHLQRVRDAGGRVTTPKTAMSETHDAGYYAIFTDTEGNELAFYSYSGE